MVKSIRMIIGMLDLRLVQFIHSLGNSRSSVKYLSKHTEKMVQYFLLGNKKIRVICSLHLNLYIVT